ncbi:MAG: hypothetical protein EBU82_01205 [Flavobacteriia bacterium]|nr:hypothetical protein [Flavobacteriia bacterium]
MDGLNISWRGQPHSGKRTALHAALKQLASLRGIPFTLQTKQFFTGGTGKSDANQISTTAEDDGGDDGGSEKDSFPYEFSLIHIGFDIARMSMQDKIYLKPILQRWSTGSQVLAGNQGRASRILVFYHAHLFSTESYFLLHSLLENNFGDVSIWMTSELPVAERLSDYFIEIPVATQTLTTGRPSWSMVFEKMLQTWSQKPFPHLSETTEIRNFLYELLMRNLRWTDCVHYLLDAIFHLPLESEKKKKLLSILAKQEATAAGQTIPSYRIPLLWEALFLEIREAVSQPRIDGGPSSSSQNISKRSKVITGAAAPKVATRQPKSRGATSVSNGSVS